jgi:hypothetical protein
MMKTDKSKRGYRISIVFGLTAKDQLRLERGVTPAAAKPKQEA